MSYQNKCKVTNKPDLHLTKDNLFLSSLNWEVGVSIIALEKQTNVRVVCDANVTVINSPKTPDIQNTLLCNSNVHIPVPKWCIVEYEAGALWDLLTYPATKNCFAYKTVVI